MKVSLALLLPFPSFPLFASREILESRHREETLENNLSDVVGLCVYLAYAVLEAFESFNRRLMCNDSAEERRRDGAGVRIVNWWRF